VATVARADQATPATPAVRVRLLGELDVRVGDEPVPLPGSARARSLLGLLALQPGVALSRQRLAFLLWPDSTEAQARTNLRNVLHQLRRASPHLDAIVEVTPSTLRCDPARCRVDVAELLTALERADAVGPGSDERVVALREAVALSAGELLDGCYDDWLLEERERLRDRQASALRRLVEELLLRGDHISAVPVVRELVRREPLNEDHHRLRIRVHGAAGDRAGALRAFHECAAVLEQELGVGPSVATRQAHAAVMGAEDGQGPPGQARQLAAALVGRDDAWRALRQCWHEAEAGQSRLVLVTGEPGIGKTRLVEELASWCEHGGAAVARARAYASEGELGYGMVISWLRAPAIGSRLRPATVPHLGALSRLLPELGGAPVLAAAAADRDEADKMRLFEAVAAALTSVGGPTLLVADDAQWADTLSLQVIHYMVRAARAGPVVVVATARQEDLDGQHPLTAVADALRLIDSANEVPLERLTRDETAELARHLGGADESGETLYEETEGNPLFVVETVRAGVRGAVGRDGLTPKLQSVIGARLRQLSEPALDLLGVAAAVGRSFTAELVGRAGGVDDLTLVRGLDELWRRGLIREHGADAYDFSHGKIRDATYDALSPAARRRNHVRVAEALLELRHQDLDEASGEIARAYDRAGRAAEAIAWYQRAAVQALRRSADSEAVRVLERALELASSLPAAGALAGELEVLSLLPTALVAVEGYTSDRMAAVQRRAGEVAAALKVELDPQVLRSLVVSSLCRDEFPEARDAAERLQRSAAAAGDDGLGVESCYLLGISAFWSVDLPAARAHFEAAVDRFDPEQRDRHLLRFGQDPSLVCLSRLANTLWFLGDTEQAQRAALHAVAEAGRVGHPFTTDVVHVFAAVLALDVGDADAFCRHADHFTASRHGSGILDIKAPALLGLVDVIEGRRAAGIAAIRAAIARCEGRNPAPGFQALLRRVLVAAHHAAGDPAGGLAAADQALHLGGTRLWEAEVRRLRAGFLAALGSSRSEVADEFGRALGIARAQGARGLEARIAAQRSSSLPTG
jgi:DNA-binding SARP family transcriptional activator